MMIEHFYNILIELNIILKTLHAYYENKEMNFTVLF